MRYGMLHSTIRGALHAAVALTIATVAFHADASGIYKWIDRNNVTTFSQLPPGYGVSVEQLREDAVPAPAAATDAVVLPTSRGTRALDRLITPEMRRLGIRLADTPREQEAQEAQDARHGPRSAPATRITHVQLAWQ